MKKNRTRLYCAVLIGLISTLPAAAQTQEKLTAAPDPSYAEGGPPAYRHPELEEGTAVFIPAGLEYRFLNPSDEPLEVYLVVEETSPGFVPNTEISVGSYHDSRPLYGAHWAHIAHPHTHGPGTEEIWLQVRGRSLLFFGNRLLWQEPGEAFLIPPNNKVPHSSINHTDEPMLWLYMGCRHEEDANNKEQE